MRIDRDTALMGTAFVWANRSTCSRLHVGAVISREGRILVQGYNGAPAGLPHCNHECTCPEGYPYQKEGDEVHRMGCPVPEPCLTAEHAERNAIAWAARNGVRLEGGTLHVTDAPCYNCAMSVVNAGLIEVVYVRPYRLTHGVDLLITASIRVTWLDDWEEPSIDESAEVR